MDDIITSEQVLELGKKWALRRMPLEKILSYYTIEERLEALEKILPNYTIEERLRGLSIEERLRGLNPDDIRAYLKRLEEGQQ